MSEANPNLEPDSIHTSGGAAFTGDINTAGGNFIARDQIIHGDKVMGDQINIGNISPHARVIINNNIDLEQKRIETYLYKIQAKTRKDMNGDVYISTTVNLQPISFKRPALSTPGDSAAKYSTDHLQAILDNSPMFVLLGKPGAGKSSALNHLSLKAIQNFTERKRIPLLVNLSKWPANQLFMPYVQYLWSTEHDLPGTVHTREILLLLDGLNELANPANTRSSRIEDIKSSLQKNELANPANTRSRIEDIKSSLREFKDAQVVITCRQNDYGTILDLGFPRVTLEPLNNEQIDSYLQHWNVTLLRKTFLPNPNDNEKQNTNLYQLVRTPYILSLFVSRYLQGDPKEHDLQLDQMYGGYGKIFEHFTKEVWKREADFYLRPNHYKYVPALEIMQLVLSELAFQMIAQEQGTSVNTDFVEQVLAQNSKTALDWRLVLRLAESATILEISNDGYSSIQFKHQLLQEYFAALALKRNIASNQHYLRNLVLPIGQLRFERTQDGRRVASIWDQVIAMLAGLTDDPDQFLLDLALLDPFLTAEVVETVVINYKTEQQLQQRCINELKQSLRDRQWHKGIIAADALAKLPSIDAVSLLYEFEQSNSLNHQVYQAVYRAYHAIGQKSKIPRLLQAFPTHNKNYGLNGEPIVWLWVRHKRLDGYPFDHLYLEMQLFKDSSGMAQDRLQVEQLWAPVEAEVSDMKSAIDILDTAHANELTQYIKLLPLLKHQEVVRLIVKWIPTTENGYITKSLIHVLIKNKITQVHDVLGLLDMPGKTELVIESLCELVSDNNQPAPPLVETLLKNWQFASRLVDIASTTPEHKLIFNVLSILGQMPPEICNPAFANLVVQVARDIEFSQLYKKEYELFAWSAYERFVNTISEKNIYVRLSGKTLDGLIYIVAQAIKKDEPQRVEPTWALLAAETLGYLQQKESLPILLEWAKQKFYKCVSPLGYMGSKDGAVIHLLTAKLNSEFSRSAAIALGRLKAREAVPALLQALKNTLDNANKQGLDLGGEGCIEALGEIGSSHPESIGPDVTAIIEQALMLEPTKLMLTMSPLGSYATYKISAVTALYQKFGSKNSTPLAVALQQVPALENEIVDNFLSTKMAILVDCLLDVITKLHSGTFNEFLPALQTIATFLDQSNRFGYWNPYRYEVYDGPSWEKIHIKTISLLAKNQDETCISFLKKALNSRGQSNWWENAITFLAWIATPEAIEAMCVVYFNRKGDYNPEGIYSDATHDKLCVLATQKLISIGTLEAFQIFVSQLDKWFQRRANGELQAYQDEIYWTADVRNELKTIKDRTRLRNFIQAWLLKSTLDNTRDFIVLSIAWNPLAIEVLEYELKKKYRSDISYAQKILEALKQQNVRPRLDDNQKLPTLEAILSSLIE